MAQLILGIVYYEGVFIEKNINKAKYYIKKASIHEYFRNYFHNFTIGFFYHDGKILEKNIEKAIHHYKNASSMNLQYAKNNLGVIYIIESDVIVKNVPLAIVYFNEAIRKDNDILSKYNLALVYLIYEPVKNSIEQSVYLFIEVLNSDFSMHILPLCMAIIKKIGFNINIKLIEKELEKYTNKYQILSNKIYVNIIKMNIDNEIIYKKVFNSLNEEYYIYNYLCYPICIKSLYQANNQHTDNKKNITADFYDGFGRDI